MKARLVALVALALVACSCGGEGPEIAATVTVGMDGERIVEAPAGVVEIAAFAPAGPDGAAAAFRDASSGSYSVWRLDMAHMTWRRQSERLFKYPVAMAADARGILLVLPNRTSLAVVLREGRVASETEIPGLPRAAVAKADGSWWLAGLLPKEGRPHLAARMDGDEVVEFAFPAPAQPWMEWGHTVGFTGLAVRPDRLFATSPGSCELMTWRDDVVSGVRLDAADPQEIGGGGPTSPGSGGRSAGARVGLPSIVRISPLPANRRDSRSGASTGCSTRRATMRRPARKPPPSPSRGSTNCLLAASSSTRTAAPATSSRTRLRPRRAAS